MNDSQHIHDCKRTEELVWELRDERDRLTARVADFESGRVYEELQEKINKLRAFKKAVLRAFEAEYGPPGPYGIGPPWTDEIAALEREEV